MPGSQFIDKAEEHITSVANQFDTLKKAGETIAKAVLDGKKVFIMDRFDIVDAEMVDHPSGLALFRSYKIYGNTMTDGDIFILAAYFPDNEDDRSLVEQARARGAFIITISPKGLLSQSAGLALLNDDSANGVITIPGITGAFCPVSGIINTVLAWSLAAETVSALLAQGVQPTVSWGEYFANSEGKSAEARKRFLSLGY
ncbi:hypothetical protein LLG96_08945 [bacterium]|nr:hypothetical protein [bacterium]